MLSAVIAIIISSYLVLAFWLFYIGLKFIARFPGLGTVLIERLMFLLFAFLFVLLLLSNLVIGYTNLFRNRETSFLLTLPVSTHTIFQWKFIESAVLASWAFVFLIAPLLAAFGLTRGVAWHFYLVTLLLVGLFIVLPAVVGSFFAVNSRALSGPASVPSPGRALLLADWWWAPRSGSGQNRSAEVDGDPRLGGARQAALPNPFRGVSVVAQLLAVRQRAGWAEGGVAGGGLLGLVLMSYVAFFGTLSFTRMGGLFYDAASTMQSRGSVFGRWDWFRRSPQTRSPHRRHSRSGRTNPRPRSLAAAPTCAHSW